ncbi:MAG: hypothetical protein ACT4PU_05655 [Planctomycetota bacterium]
MRRSSFLCRSVPQRFLSAALLLAVAGQAWSQDAPPVVPAAATVDELARQLAAERAARVALEARMARLEAALAGQTGQAAADAEADALEAQLRALLPPGDLTPAAQRVQSFPSAYNPKIGVFMDATAEGGSFDRKLGVGDEKLSLRETEIDFRLPISPFAQGVAIVTLHDEGGGEFHTAIEEGYADVSLGGLFDTDSASTARIGRFRPMFGRNNRLHRHDWLQAHLPLPVRNLLGEEGLVGDGLAFTIPIGSTTGGAGFGGAAGSGGGSGSATVLDLAIVDGSMLTGEESLLGEIAAGTDTTPPAGTPLGLDSDAPVATARLSHYRELGPLSDIELGLSTLQPLGDDAITTDFGAGTAPDTRVHPAVYGIDLTWRSRDDETGVGSWLVQAEALRSVIDYGDVFTAGTFAPFPFGDERREGWYLTVQRQVSPTVYIGVNYGQSDVLASADSERSITPYVSWYADEFFRIRAQVEALTRNVSGGPDIHGAYRAALQFTWNFGSHQPHPYWVNR